MKPGRAALLFALLFAFGLVFHTGWGTPSAFGVDVVAALCPVGALETWAASGTIAPRDRKSTRLNSSHLGISYAVF